jgi:hypothetical protein
MLKEFREDLLLPISEAEELPRLIAFREAAEGLNKLPDDFAFRLRRVGRRG